MKIGFINACLSELTFEEQLKWAHANGFGYIEIHTAPRTLKVNLKKIAADKGEAHRFKELLAEYELTVSSFLLGGHHLHPDKERRIASQQHLKDMILAAEALDVPYVTTFIGRDHRLTVKDNYELVKQNWLELMRFAEAHGRKIAIENCPMLEEWPGGYNIAFSPENWEEIFNLIPSDSLGLNFDPSHLAWLGIDYIAALKNFASKVFLTQAKDTEVMQDKLNQKGILGEGWWRYRLPGLGQVDWGKFINTLYELGYDGPVTIEHEDPVWEGSLDKIQRGLAFSHKYLSQFLV
ncbi:MAG: sugar phosphate isomerase/epimerase [Chloroflexi bacterium]|uniref:Sugar phosphate isomerase/epimerase n=1 Tax=Candidatus Chlorohelix allophototropha TaxID=3003348 RepID=A0A8T7M436_9CHLR|nr:sugar phosphate isomerase/epimerase [Chloroflexota bacterium]WJW70164.1 sugar phosphate isomerase/epimerase [Chloroflexota bacterium L227-S17]